MKKLGDRGHQQIRMLLTFLAMLETPKKRYLFKNSPHPLGGNTNLRWFIAGRSAYRNLYPPPSFQGQIQNRNHILRLNNMQMIQGDLLIPLWTAPAAVVQQCIVVPPASSRGLSKPSISEKVEQKGWFSSDWGAHKIKSTCIVGGVWSRI